MKGVLLGGMGWVLRGMFLFRTGEGDGRTEVVVSDRPIPSGVFQRPTGVPAPC